MPKMLIDANKYLDFYRNLSLSPLLVPLLNLRTHILVTRQIVDEVERNKLRVFVEAVQESFKRNGKPAKAAPPMPIMPEDRQGTELKESIKKFNKAADELSKGIDAAFTDLFEKIAQSTDLTSVSLERFFGLPLAAGEEAVSRARSRKEVGNPPGKKSDPLGDQITWEQFVLEIRGQEKVWIVSSDSDILLEFNGKIRLNPKLHKEVIAAAGTSVEMHLFTTLADAIPDFITTNGLNQDGLPSLEVLGSISESERLLDQPVSCLPFPPPGQIPPPSSCPRCGKKGLFYGPHSRPSEAGGFTWQFVCSKCGGSIDTGEHICD